MRVRIQEITERIAYSIYEKAKRGNSSNSRGLYTGELGNLLFLFYYSKSTTNTEFWSLSEVFSEELLNDFSSLFDTFSYCDGLAGVLYLFEYLRERDFIDIDISTVREDLETYLIAHARREMKNNNYDFMHGSLGIGLFFLKTNPNHPFIDELIDFLYNTAEKDIGRKIFKWKSILDEKNNIGYNIALSHGISSIILFLNRMLKKGTHNDKVLMLMEGAINYILTQEIDFDLHGSFFPVQSLDNDCDVYINRLAWCYGDLGVAYSLWCAGKTLGKINTQEKAMNILVRSTQLRSFSETRVKDAGICHGSAGVAMIFHRLYLETGNPIFDETYNYWIEQTLNFSKFEDGLAGFKTFNVNNWENDYSLLTGISGIGLVFLSFLYDDEQSWDELFLLS